jgi:hypothetical protein
VEVIIIDRAALAARDRANYRKAAALATANAGRPPPP